MPSTIPPIIRRLMAALGAAMAVAAVVLAAATLRDRVSPAPAAPFPPTVTIGVLRWNDVDRATLAGFQAGLAERGYAQATYLDSGTAGSAEAARRILRGYLDHGIDLLLVSGTQAALMAEDITRHAGPPVIFAPVNDPVGSGVVVGLRHPGGNATGIRLRIGDDLRLDWLTRLAPASRRILVPSNPDDPSSRTSLNAIRPVAARLGLTLRVVPVRNAAEVGALMAALPADIDAIFLPRDGMVEAEIASIAAAAKARHLPVSAPAEVQVEQGALFCYGFSHVDIGRQAARLADQVLRGIRPGDLPVETAENRLVVNRATAAALGQSLPPDLAAQVDRFVGEAPP